MSGGATNSYANYKMMETSSYRLAFLASLKHIELEMKFRGKGIVKDDDFDGEERRGARFIK